MGQSETPQPVPSPSEVERLRAEVERLRAEVEQERKANRKLLQQAQDLKRQVRDLKSELSRLKTTSATSSKPPSSDIVKPPRNPSSSKRKIGAQPGHPKHERRLFPPEQIDAFAAHSLSQCPDCHGPVSLSPGLLPTVVQQVEIVAKPIHVTQHTAGWYWCAHCQKSHCPLPAPVEKAGLCGPVLSAWIAFLKGGCHASFSTIRHFLRDVLGLPISRGMLAKVIAKASAALADPWEHLRQLLPLQDILNIDETGHKENGRRLQTWCFRAKEYVLFRIEQTRGAAVLLEALGADFNGIIGCDYFSSYRCYMKDFGGVLQFCLAHLIRDVKFLCQLPDPATQAYGTRYLESLQALFALIHRRETLTAGAFQAALQGQRAHILRVATENVPATREARNLARRMELHGDSYFRFITTPGLEPTNNLAEQAIRFVVIDRLVTQGTRSERGRRWSERIWSVIATCRLQGRSAYEFLRNAIQAHFTGTPAPNLLPHHA